jgi:N-formylglutamate amidohydrolase
MGAFDALESLANMVSMAALESSTQSLSDLEADPPEAPFVLTRPPAGARATPLIFATPHSGRIYPPSLRAASRLDAQALRGSEDVAVDALIAEAPGLGVPVLAARLARAFVDLNRAPWDLDPAMFDGDLPAYAQSRSARVGAGLGVIARIVREGEEIYGRKLTFAEAARRIEAAHRPYHQALTDLTRETVNALGVAVLIDWHSMPSAATAHEGPGAGCDLVVGDRFGASAAPAVTRRVEAELRDLGYRVARNAPYAGGYTTEHYGRPAQKVHALQIEVSRGLYLDEASLTITAGFVALKADLTRLTARLAAADWSAL